MSALVSNESFGHFINADRNVVSIATNLSVVKQVYGDGAAHSAINELKDQLYAVGVKKEKIVLYDDYFLISYHPELNGQESGFSTLLRRTIRPFAVHSACGSFVFDCAVKSDAVAGAMDADALTGPIGNVDALNLDNDIVRFKADMACAAFLWDCLDKDDVYLTTQPVLGFDNCRKIKGSLYYELLLRVGCETRYSPYEMVTALERLGLIFHLDQAVILNAITFLRNSVDDNVVLGCNVSVRSFEQVDWWERLILFLQLVPSTAEKLLLEVTESWRAHSGSPVLDILARLRSVGVKIALDDVGAGLTTIEFIVNAKADIIKIDKVMLMHSRNIYNSPDLLRNFVRMCKDYAKVVVVEGVESFNDLKAIQYALADGAQGFYFNDNDNEWKNVQSRFPVFNVSWHEHVILLS